MSETDLYLQNNSQLHLSYKSISVEPSFVSPRLCFGFELSQGPINLSQPNLTKAAFNNFTNFVVELKLITKNEEYIGSLSPKQPFVSLHPNDRVSLYFNLLLDHHTLAQIEKLRESKDLYLGAYFTFSGVCPMEPQHQGFLNAQIRFTVPKSDWVEKYLPSLGFKTVSLIEVPQLKDGEFTEIIANMNNAWKQYSMGDYFRVFTDCRKATELLSNKVKDAGFKKQVTNRETGQKKTVPDWREYFENEELGEAFGALNRKIFRLTSTGPHGNRRIGREDADFALMTTHAMVNLVVQKFKQ